MKNFAWAISIFAALFSGFLFSCSNNSSDVDVFDETETLKYEATRLETELDWQNEIEGEILTKEIKKKVGIDSSRVTLTHRAVLANEKSGDDEKIYPYLEGFGSLDLSDFTMENDAERRKLVEDFCNALVERKECEEFFDKDSIFALAIFLDDLKAATGINYFELMDVDEKENIDSIRRILSYILGKPLSDEAYFSVPVRFKVGTDSKKENLDVEIFLEKYGEAWKIDEIEVRKTK